MNAKVDATQIMPQVEYEFSLPIEWYGSMPILINDRASNSFYIGNTSRRASQKEILYRTILYNLLHFPQPIGDKEVSPILTKRRDFDKSLSIDWHFLQTVDKRELLEMTYVPPCDVLSTEPGFYFSEVETQKFILEREKGIKRPFSVEAVGVDAIYQYLLCWVDEMQTGKLYPLQTHIENFVDTIKTKGTKNLSSLCESLKAARIGGLSKIEDDWAKFHRRERTIRQIEYIEQEEAIKKAEEAQTQRTITTPNLEERIIQFPQEKVA